MDKIIFATGNKNKMIEIKMILSDLGAEILSQKEAGIEAEVVEDGTTFEENALIKAEAISKIARSMPEYKNTVVLADDSGLEIDYLNKEPGIYSARYMGEDTSYDIKNNELLRRLEGVPKEDLSAQLRRHFRMEPVKCSGELWKELLVIRLQVKMGLGMIRFFIFPNISVPVLNLRLRKRMS